MNKREIKALIFDVFGTVVDWRSSIKKGLRNFLPQNISEDELETFAVEWRSGYSEYLNNFNVGKEVWKKIDEVHLEKLNKILNNRNLSKYLNEKEIIEINFLWHKLDPWPDTVEGLRLLKKKFSIGTLSNGNFSLLLNMSKNADLSWDFIFSGDIFKKYKPNPYVYKRACEYLDLSSSEVALVAAHENDLLAAKDAGLRTIYVERVNEFNTYKQPNNINSFDFLAEDFIDISTKI